MYYEEIPIAVLSYVGEIINEENIFLISQIQLTKLYDNQRFFFTNDIPKEFLPNRYLESFEWQKAMVKIAEILAKFHLDTKYKKIGIVTAENAINNKTNQYAKGLRKDKAEETYNKTAIEMNYQIYDENLFIKEI